MGHKPTQTTALKQQPGGGIPFLQGEEEEGQVYTLDSNGSNNEIVE